MYRFIWYTWNPVNINGRPQQSIILREFLHVFRFVGGWGLPSYGKSFTRRWNSYNRPPSTRYILASGRTMTPLKGEERLVLCGYMVLDTKWPVYWRGTGKVSNWWKGQTVSPGRPSQNLRGNSDWPFTNHHFQCGGGWGLTSLVELGMWSVGEKTGPGHGDKPKNIIFYEDCGWFLDRDRDWLQSRFGEHLRISPLMCWGYPDKGGRGIATTWGVYGRLILARHHGL